MKNYVLYHGNCPDGFAAATVAWLKMGDENTIYTPVSYGTPQPEMEDGSQVFILDFSYAREELFQLSQRMKRVVVLDHHATAQTALEGLELIGEDSEIIFDMDKSGAVLAWEFFQEKEVPEFILYIQDRDLWQWKLDKSREVSYAVRSYPHRFDLWCQWIGIGVGRLKAEGTALLRLADQMISAMCKHHRWAYLNTMTRRISFSEFLNPAHAVPTATVVMPVANATVMFSEVGERLLEMFPNEQCAAYYSDRVDGKQQWGLRSRADFDCSAIAKSFGGGGHKQASGFVL